MRGRIFPAVLTALSLMLVSAEGSAQGTARSNTTKLFLGLDLNGSSIDSDDIDADSESGAGATVKIGYGFTRLFSLYLEGTAASIDAADETFTLSHGELGARFHFGGETAVFIPYLDLAFTQRALSVDDFTFEDDQGAPVTGDLEISGPAVSFGVGSCTS